MSSILPAVDVKTGPDGGTGTACTSGWPSGPSASPKNFIRC